MLKFNADIPVDILSGRVLDIGCGMGNGVVAALSAGASFCVGVDRSFSEFDSVFDISEFPEICARFDVDNCRTLLLECDIFQTRFAPGSFDLCIMLDAIEHVPNPAAFIRYAFHCLRKGGYFLIHTCPLYHSIQGHHLFGYFPASEFPWVHLWKDFDEQLLRVRDQWALDRFHELNQVTHDDLVAMLQQAGFDIAIDIHGAGTPEMRLLLDQARDRIEPQYLKQPDLLFGDWIRMIGVR